jgi:hypothetical protein
MFIYHCPEGSTPELALDAALRKASDKARDRKYGRDDGDQPDLTELRAKLERLLQQALPEDRYDEAMDLLSDCGLLESKMYGDVGDADDPDGKYPDRSRDPDAAGKMRAFLEGKLSEDDLEEAMSQMPETAMSGRMNAAIEDRRRGGRDRRRGAMDSAQSSFDRLFPDAARIKSATTFR